MLIADAADVAGEIAWPLAVVISIIVLAVCATTAIRSYIGRIDKIQVGAIRIDTPNVDQCASRLESTLERAAKDSVPPPSLAEISKASVNLGWALCSSGKDPSDFKLTWEHGHPVIDVQHNRPPSIAP
jgi:hypothetical protein